MKKMNGKTFLVNEIQYILNTNSRSIKEFVRQNDPRADELILALMVETRKFFITSSDKRLAELSNIAYSFTVGIATKYERKIIKHFNLYCNYIEQLEYKKSMTELINDTEYLSFISNDLGLNYGNVYRFFIKKDSSALKYNVAQQVIIQKKKFLKEIREQK